MYPRRLGKELRSWRRKILGTVSIQQNQSQRGRLHHPPRSRNRPWQRHHLQTSSTWLFACYSCNDMLHDIKKQGRRDISARSKQSGSIGLGAYYGWEEQYLCGTMGVALSIPHIARGSMTVPEALCEPLLVSKHYLNRNEPARTTWTEAGKQLVKTQKSKDRDVATKPGEYVMALKSETDDYFMCPGATGHFCHSWVRISKRRLDVVVIEGLGLPSVNKTSGCNAQYCSLFFRPWTLRRGDATLPHLSLFGRGAAVLQHWQESLDSLSLDHSSCRLTKKTTKNVLKSALDMMSWRYAWDEYVRGNVVSLAAAKIIQRFPSIRCLRQGKRWATRRARRTLRKVSPSYHR